MLQVFNVLDGHFPSKYHSVLMVGKDFLLSV